MNKQPENIHFIVSPVFELLAAMFRVNAHEALLSDISREVAGQPAELNQWVEQKRAALPEKIKNELDLFFNPESFFGLTLIRFAWEHDAHQDVSTFLRRVEETPAKQLFVYFFKTGFPEEELEDVSDFNEAASYIEQSNLPEKEKWKATYLFAHAEETKRRFVEVVRNFHVYIEDEMADLLEKQRSSLEDMKHYIEEKGVETLVSNQLQPVKDGELVIAASVFYYDCSLTAETDDLQIFLFGIRQFQLKADLTVNKEELTRAFKILADEKRLNIIRLLKQGPLYGYELAQRLSLSNSTVSHHLSALTSVNLVKAARKENRVYYEVQPKEIEKLMEQMKQTLILP